MVTDLAALPTGSKGVVVELSGGMGMRRKLDAMGVRPGKVIQKVSSQLMAGPVTVLIDGRQVAMGRGIARRVRVRTV
jgi:ferrous iron transport protein A